MDWYNRFCRTWLWCYQWPVLVSIYHHTPYLPTQLITINNCNVTWSRPYPPHQDWPRPQITSCVSYSEQLLRGQHWGHRLTPGERDIGIAARDQAPPLVINEWEQLLTDHTPIYVPFGSLSFLTFRKSEITFSSTILWDTYTKFDYGCGYIISHTHYLTVPAQLSEECGKEVGSNGGIQWRGCGHC